MEREWFIGTVADDPLDEHGHRHSTFDLAVRISEEEHEALKEAANSIQRTLRGVLFRLVFANHRALKDHEARMRELLTGGDRRSANWGEAHIQTQVAFANWLGSVRWLLDHAKTRLQDEPDKLKQFEDVTRREFDRHFAYRLTYKLRDYTTHCDLPPLSMHVESRAVGAGERTDTLTIQLRPGDLLNAWDRWGTHVKRDLTGRSEPIDLMPLVDEAMACIERVMLAIISADAREHQAAARLVVDAVKRLPQGALEDGPLPVLFAAEMEGDSIKNVSPTRLPVTEARDMLNPPPATNA